MVRSCDKITKKAKPTFTRLKGIGNNLKPQPFSSAPTETMRNGCDKSPELATPLASLATIHILAPTSFPTYTHHASHWWHSALEVWHNVFWPIATKKHPLGAR